MTKLFTSLCLILLAPKLVQAFLEAPQSKTPPPPTLDEESSAEKQPNSNGRYDPIADWTPPLPDEVDSVIRERVDPLRRLVSPVFFSTDRNGKRHRGLSRLSSSDARPLLVVGNHQLGGFDMWLAVPQLYEDRDIWLRGLGHSVIFDEGSVYIGGGRGGPMGGFEEQKRQVFGLFQRFGAVEVSPRNFYRLMETGQAALHFPGGAREAYHGRGEDYKLFWPDRIDFIRVAAKFNATIVPLSAVGAADSADVLVGPDALLKLPFGVGDAVANSPITVPARFNDAGLEERRPRPPPLIVPKPLPARHYFLFGRPMSTEHLDHREKDRCREMYLEIQQELRRGIDDLLRAREKDPFKGNAARIAYEYVTKKQAPTFSVRELN